jgi:hypothetical protein
MRPDLDSPFVQNATSTRSSLTDAGRSPGLMGKISILVASLTSVLCMAGLFVTVALAAGPHAAQHGGAHGKAKPAGLCLLHDLVR